MNEVPSSMIAEQKLLLSLFFLLFFPLFRSSSLWNFNPIHSSTVYMRNGDDSGGCAMQHEQWEINLLYETLIESIISYFIGNLWDRLRWGPSNSFRKLLLGQTRTNSTVSDQMKLSSWPVFLFDDFANFCANVHVM